MSQTATAVTVMSVPLDEVIPDKHQVRRHFDEDALQQLAASIREHGVIQPIVVRPPADGEPSQLRPYEVIAGERRYRAARLAGLQTIPAIIRADLVGQDISVLQILENLQRADLSLPETAAGVAKLVEKIGNAEAAKQLGKSESWVSKHARIGELPERIRKHIDNGQIESADVAHDLNTLLKLDEKTATHYLDVLDKPQDERASWEQVPTRAAVREDIEEAKEEAAHRKAIVEKRKNGEVDPEEQKHREQRKAEEKARQETRERIKRLEAETDQLEDEASQQFGRVFGFAAAQRDEDGHRRDQDQPVSIRHFGYYSEYQPNNVPKTVDGAKFFVDAQGDAAHMLRVAKATGWQLQVTVHVEALTTGQAVQLEKLLGPDLVSFQVRAELKGREVRKLIKQLEGVTPEADRKVGTSEKNGDMDVAAFLADRITITGDDADRIKAADVHAAYVTWCKKHKREALPLNGAANAWGDAIAAAGISKHRLKTGVHYLGITLK